MINTMLIKSANEASNVTHYASFRWKIHFPHERPVTENPHFRYRQKGTVYMSRIFSEFYRKISIVTIEGINTETVQVP